jgi:hypothetical protein
VESGWHRVEELQDVELVQIKTARSNMENSVTGSLGLRWNLISRIDESHELIDVDFSVFVGVHLCKNVLNLFFVDVSISSFDNKLLKLLHVESHTSHTFFCLIDDLLFVKCAHIFHSIFHL